ncbi:hypothetical protein P154DRAFT_566058 [Amniculicola lignicola CBS 123094]|uniref:Transcription factor tfiiic complex a box associated subunit sfc1 n=1 Tax=Amniculicola lignicola CBS 123094 TaxID=1392246 RepID=A0A6A5W8M1_9PLEO|nr:hypothetical protein P154DRAFT_566058 [Amniculicola lignicola CBS 123094]
MDVEDGPSDRRTREGLAPLLPVPLRAVTSIEHPCMVKNVDKAIESLGGAMKLSQGLQSQLPNIEPEEDDKVDYFAAIGVSLRPQDRLAKRIPAFPVDTSNLLLKITVPKRTGRRRKRGSNGPFSHDGTTEQSSSSYVPTEVVLRSLNDNADKYSVTAVGIINETNRFRELPDIQFASADSPLMQNARDKLFSLRYSDISKYQFNTMPGSDRSTGMAPSAKFMQLPVFYDYKYQQNPAVRYTQDGGVELNVHRHLALMGYHIIPATAEFVPMGPRPGVPAEEDQPDDVRRMIRRIRYEMKYRPIITRRVLFNRCGWSKRQLIRNAAVYCGYFFDTGPWREALIAWGLDPRKDPDYRKLQTISYSSFGRTGDTRTAMFWSQHVSWLAQIPPEKLVGEHLFDGHNVSQTGSIFQFCDILDPQIRRILDTHDIRKKCAPGFQGWYHAGTWAKATVILKHKMNILIRDQKLDPAVYEPVVNWPEKWDDTAIWDTYRDDFFKEGNRKDKTKLATFRLMLNVRMAARNPKYAFERIEEQYQRDAENSEDAEGMDDHTAIVPEDTQEFPDQATDFVFDAQPEEVLLNPRQVFSDSEEDEAEAEADGPEDDQGGSDDRSGPMEGVEEDSQSDSSMDFDGVVKKPVPFGGLFSA